MHHGNIDVRAVRAAIIADVDEVEVVVSHHERATLRVGDDVRLTAEERFPMQTRAFPATADARSPAGAEIRYLMAGTTGTMIHSNVPPGQVNRATIHATVSEFWHVLSGEGQIWRRDGSGEQTTALTPGVSIDIPVGTAFQYRCTGVDPLTFLCISMPPWPGDHEATIIEGPWRPTAPEG